MVKVTKSLSCVTNITGTDPLSLGELGGMRANSEKLEK